LDGDGARASPAVWGALGQRPTEGPRSITTIVPCPHHSPGQGRIRVAGRGAWQRAGLDGCRKAGPMLGGTVAATKGNAGVLTRAQRGMGVSEDAPGVCLHVFDDQRAR
jgi:hypothetical protein